jgi:hypothetical protein
MFFQVSKKVISNIVWKLSNIISFDAGKIIVVPNKQWSNQSEVVITSTVQPRPKTEISAIAINDAMPFIKVENVFDLRLFKVCVPMQGRVLCFISPLPASLNGTISLLSVCLSVRLSVIPLSILQTFLCSG